MRADAQKNYAHLLTTARAVIDEQGANASLRDIARRAGVGLGTLYRHFPTREALLEVLLRATFDKLTERAEELAGADSPADALVSWFREVVYIAHNPRGLVSTMAAAIANEDSALHASCITMRTAGTRLLTRAQAAGVARTDMEGPDLFALVGALAWVYEQPALRGRADLVSNIIVEAITTS